MLLNLIKTVSFVTLITILTACNNTQPLPPLNESGLPLSTNDKFYDEKKEFIESLKRELKASNQNPHQTNEIEDELFIYKQLMNRNF